MIEQDALNSLLHTSVTPGYGVSVYIPTHRKGVQELHQDKTRLKNQLDVADTDLRQLGVRKKDRDTQLEPGYRMLRDEPFWRYQNEGLAVFMSPDFAVWYTLPESVSEITVTARMYHMKPLLFLSESRMRFYILALSPASVRLLQVDGGHVETLDAPDLPGNIDEAHRHKTREPTQQHFVAGGQGRGNAVTHGHGGLKDYKEIELQKFVHNVAKTVAHELRNENVPLVFAGDEELYGLYHSHANHPKLLESYLRGNHDDVSEQELYMIAKPLAEAYFQDNPHPVLDSFYHVRAHEPERVSSQLSTIIQVAGQGRVAELLLMNETTVWGNVSLDYSAKALPGREPGAVDLLDVAAREAYAHGGNVHSVHPDSMPDNSAAAAIFRY